MRRYIRLLEVKWHGTGKIYDKAGEGQVTWVYGNSSRDRLRGVRFEISSDDVDRG